MRAGFRLYLRLISIQIRSQLQYRAAFLFEILSMFLVEGIFFVTFALVIQRFGNIAGWSLGEVAMLWAMAEISFGTMDLLFSGFDPDSFSPMIRRGSFDQIMLRPVRLELQVLGSRFLMRRLSRIAEGLAILVYAIAVTSIHWTVLKGLVLIMTFCSQVVFFGALFITGATLTFWTIQPIEAMNVLTYGGNEMISYPMNIYQDWMRHFFTFIVPAIFLNYTPMLYILGKPDPLHLPAFTAFLSPFVAILSITLAISFWRFGVMHYQSTGS